MAWVRKREGIKGCTNTTAKTNGLIYYLLIVSTDT